MSGSLVYYIGRGEDSHHAVETAFETEVPSKEGIFCT